jgi:hypothetical protein
MRRTALAIGVMALLSMQCALSPTAIAETGADIELVLAVDVSGSVDKAEQELERTGLVLAFQDRQVIEAIQALPHGVAVAVVAFAGAKQTRTVVAWHHLTHPATIAVFADRIAAAFPVAFEHCGLTAIGDAVAWSLEELAANGFGGLRKVDVSGDGSNSDGEDPASVRDRAVAAGVTINGLAILNEETFLADYYRRAVIGGPGAFVLTASDYESFAEAIRLKLLRELAPGPTALRGAN